CVLPITEPRPLNGRASSSFRTVEELSVKAMKNSGPSPGDGHKYKQLKTLGMVKQSGPSPGEGHSYVHANLP
ncbi:hypothetical protein U1Q18_035106, partial [Sarracenia purpurea var. burkii]